MIGVGGCEFNGFGRGGEGRLWCFSGITGCYRLWRWRWANFQSLVASRIVRMVFAGFSQECMDPL